MAYTRGNNQNIIVGAASFFIANYILGSGGLPAQDANKSYREVLTSSGNLLKSKRTFEVSISSIETD